MMRLGLGFVHWRSSKPFWSFKRFSQDCITTWVKVVSIELRWLISKPTRNIIRRNLLPIDILKIMTACTEDSILKTEDWIKHATQYVNDCLKEINVWDLITNQNMASFRQTPEALLFAFDDGVINEEGFLLLSDLNTSKSLFI